MKLCTVDGCASLLLARGMCGAHYQAWRRATGRRKRILYDCTCVVCGTEFRATTREAKYCSTGNGSCEVRAKTKPRAPKHRQLRFAFSNLKRTAPPFDCVNCGSHVVPGQDGHHCQARRYCSPVCKRRARHVARKGRKAVRDSVIFARDQWLCQLCGEPLDPEARVPHPRAPVVDHIHPIARGGTNDEANLQAAHFLCNAIKGDRVGWGWRTTPGSPKTAGSGARLLYGFRAVGVR